MSIFQRPGERVMVLMSSGNLAITQQLVSMLREAMAAQDGARTVVGANMFEAARHVGETLRGGASRDSDALQNFGIDFTAALILGGQIGTEPPRLFHLRGRQLHRGDARHAVFPDRRVEVRQADHRPRGEASHQPGRAAKLALISMDSTIRSNLSVGCPLDLAIIKTDELKISSHISIDAKNEFRDDPEPLERGPRPRLLTSCPTPIGWTRASVPEDRMSGRCQAPALGLTPGALAFGAELQKLPQPVGVDRPASAASRRAQPGSESWRQSRKRHWPVGAEFPESSPRVVPSPDGPSRRSASPGCR